jgi:hypothetical protein
MEHDDAVLLVDTGRGVRREALTAYLSAELAEAAELAANRWIKALRHARVGGQPLRDRFTHKGDSLWWFAELYFHKMRVINTIYRSTLALDALIAAQRPRRLGVAEGSPEVRCLVKLVAAREGIAWSGGGPSWTSALRSRAEVWMRAHAFVQGARIARWRAGRRRAPESVQVAGLVHAAFWRGDEEQYIGPILRRLAASLPKGALALIGVGPNTSYRARSWRHRFGSLSGRGLDSASVAPIDTFAVKGDLAVSREIWRQRRANLRDLEGSADLRRAAVIAGCDTWSLVRPILAGVAYLQFPWSAHVMDQLGASLDALRAAASSLTYAEAGGWGRALVLEARRRGVPTVGVQHGFIYRHWLNYLHEPDEMAPISRQSRRPAAFPRPDR